MRFSIRSLMLGTLVVACLWFPARGLLRWALTGDNWSTFLLGVGGPGKILLGQWDTLAAEWDRVITGPHIREYLSGQVISWTVIVLGVALVVRTIVQSVRSRDAPPSRPGRRARAARQVAARASDQRRDSKPGSSDSDPNLVPEVRQPRSSRAKRRERATRESI